MPSGSPATIFSVCQNVADRPQPAYPAAFGTVPNSRINGLPTPPSSAESSPELGVLDASSSFDSESVFPSSCMPELLSNNLVDPLLFTEQDVGSLFLCDIMIRDQAAGAFDTLALKEKPTELPSVCLGCSSGNIFQTKGSGPSIWVCRDCDSTDMDWRATSNTLQMPLQAGNARGDLSVPLFTIDASPILTGENCTDVLVGVEGNESLNLDEWVFSQDDCYNQFVEDTRSMYGEIDELFGF